ncbi:ABC-F family ATP-binding cassette domain-containing protein [Candidatus Peregrinibacteria bacterium]|nr:ABC-F family ATP-binding cassette domain-containing protein [Candidatus Peregrinibacteria bacterium]
MLIISGLNKSYGDQILFQDVDLNIAPKERIGLIGRNGSGKSTFLKMLLGEEFFLEGEIKIPKGYRIRSLEQHLNFSEKTILDQICSALPGNSSNESWKAKSILMGLGFEEKDFDRAPSEFSSGFQVRIRLAEALVSESDLLLLDEPTNYLDILSLRWLERFLKTWKGAFILITHDQRFMDLVVTHTVAIHRGHMRKMAGGPMKLMQHIKKDEEIYDKTRKNQEKKRVQEEEFIRKFRSGARSAGLVQSRIKSLAKQEIKLKLDNIPTIKFHFRSIPCKSDSVIYATNLTFGYVPDQPLIQDLSLTTFPGDRIAIIGRNGKGKSTLLKLLHQTLSPDSGKVRMPPTLAVSYFGIDSIQELIPRRSILEELVATSDASEQEVRNLCGSLLFRGDDAKKPINVISGGEKSRVCLGKTLLRPSQLLMLDEPTNHLDMESVEALTEAIEKYEGTVIFVTHNEDMLSRLATKLVLFDNNKIQVLEYGYDKFLAGGGWSEDGSLMGSTGTTDTSGDSNLNNKEARKQQRLLKKQIEKLEREIEKLEEQKKELGEVLKKACLAKDVEAIANHGVEMKKLEKLIDSKYEEMDEKMEGVI